MSKNLITRIIVAVIFGPLIVLIGYTGGYWLFGMVALFALIGIAEFLVNEGIKADSFLFWLSIIAVIVLLSSHLEINDFKVDLMLPGGLALVVLFFLVTGMILATGKQSPSELFRKHSRLIWGLLYIGGLYPYVYLLGEHVDVKLFSPSGGDLLLYLFGILWVGDTAAMGIGSWLGKRKLAPAVSPNKTIAGFVGGILGALVVGVIFYFWKFDNISYVHVGVLAVGCSVFGQLGDLVESMWKRSLGIKDSSAVIPGHGGVLDRFDSLLFAAPFMYFYLISVVL